MYSQYTYPQYTPYMDKFAPIPHQYSPLLFPEQINHYIYGGMKKSFDNYKVLVAGVGLGSDIINMGYLLKDYKNVELLGIDLSPTSLKVCRERINKYDLHNIDLIEMSILDLDPEKHGCFDLIIYIGVLHHLENPELGFSALNNVLKEDGAMNVMVYGKYGRTGVYQMQDLLKKVNHGTDDYAVKIDNFKMLYKQLPEDNWFKKGENLISDHKHSDEGIVDMLLHCQDRSYAVNDLYEWVNSCGLNIVTFTPDTRYKYKHN